MNQETDRVRRTLPGPGEALRRLWARVPRYIRITFASAFVLGLLTHLFVFTNKIPNHDDIGHLFSATYGVASGRWLLPTVLSLDGPFSLPWFIGVLSVLCLSVTACFTVSLLRIRHTVSCMVTAGLMVSFPTVASTFAYMFTADGYFLSAALAAFGAFAAVRFRRSGVPLGAVAITLSMGIYQSYFTVAAVLMVGALFFETLEGEKPCKALILKGVKLVVTLGLAMGAYFVMVKLTTGPAGLVDYMGLAEMGQISLSEIPRLVLESYARYVGFFVKDSAGFHFSFLRWLLVAAALATAALVIGALVRRKLGGARTVLALALILLYPLAGNIIVVMAAGNIHNLMIYGMVFTLVLAVAMVDRAAEGPAAGAPWRSWVRSGLSWLIILTMSLSIYSYMITDNKAYLKLHLTYEQCYSYSVRLVSAVESAPGYQRGMKIVMVGTAIREPSLTPAPQLGQVSMTGIQAFADVRSSYSFPEFLRYYVGFSDPVYTEKSARDYVMTFAERDEVTAMPTYPEPGSIRVVDDVMVVKLN